MTKIWNEEMEGITTPNLHYEYCAWCGRQKLQLPESFRNPATGIKKFCCHNCKQKYARQLAAQVQKHER